MTPIKKSLCANLGNAITHICTEGIFDWGHTLVSEFFLSEKNLGFNTKFGHTEILRVAQNIGSTNQEGSKLGFSVS